MGCTFILDFRVLRTKKTTEHGFVMGGATTRLFYIHLPDCKVIVVPMVVAGTVEIVVVTIVGIVVTAKNRQFMSNV